MSIYFIFTFIFYVSRFASTPDPDPDPALVRAFDSADPSIVLLGAQIRPFCYTHFRHQYDNNSYSCESKLSA